MDPSGLAQARADRKQPGATKAAPRLVSGLQQQSGVMATRVETDSLGPIEVERSRYWGAQTERALGHFPIGEERFPREMIAALGQVKKAAALVNRELGRISEETARLVVAAADEVIEGALDAHFPLVVWQSGSGTQTNMNANEVIANRAIEMAGGRLGQKEIVHPNDHVNASQSSNDVIPTATHIAIARALTSDLLPRVDRLRETLARKALDFLGIVKLGRTHLMDATPIALGQEVGGWASQIERAIDAVRRALPPLHEIALGGTAVGTGLGAPIGYAERVAARLAEITGLPLVTAPDKRQAIASSEAVVGAHGALRVLACALTKIANDVRLLASGPRAGLAEITLPANEPGSSIMPGKVNPTQCEALVMVAARVMGNDTTVSIAGAGGMLELSTMRPLLAHVTLQSIRLLADAAASFDERCASGIEPSLAQIAAHLDRSLMLVTALVPLVGYDAAAKIAQRALAEGTTLRAAAIASGLVTATRFDEVVRPERMVGPT
jgi:fumarate hydratase, class II